jgi:uncharacterized protein YecT (DUF1311 family)
VRVVSAGIVAAIVLCVPARAQSSATPQPADACNTGTTYDMRTCWDRKDGEATAESLTRFAEVLTAMKRRGLDTAAISNVEEAWVAARDETCAFEYGLYAGGTIAPQLGAECSVRMTRSRTARLTAYLAALQRDAAPPQELAVSAAADAELNRVYGLLAARITPEQRAALARSERAWIAYRDQACAVERGPCLTDLADGRVAELQAGWVGEAFW